MMLDAVAMATVYTEQVAILIYIYLHIYIYYKNNEYYKF